jgi:hypothetical protein
MQVNWFWQSTPIEACKASCLSDRGCVGVVSAQGIEPTPCWRLSQVSLPQCDTGTAYNLWTPTGQRELEFYMYRATARGAFQDYPLGNVNTGNLDGVMWYLYNEVVTMYTEGVRCPRTFNISTINRFKVRILATQELAADGMNLGARFTYDKGACMGRCFSRNMCTGEDDCEEHYQRYGHVPGCNNFLDKRPFPDIDTVAPTGIWYSLPEAGRCDNPTGEHDCTWSYEEAGEIPLDLLEAGFPGTGNCCNGICTSFWDVPERTTWRVQMAMDMFQQKYPNMPRDLAPATCDFNWDRWYVEDNWERRDPWQHPFWDQKYHSYLNGARNSSTHSGSSEATSSSGTTSSVATTTTRATTSTHATTTARATTTSSSSSTSSSIASSSTSHSGSTSSPPLNSDESGPGHSVFHTKPLVPIPTAPPGEEGVALRRVEHNSYDKQTTKLRSMSTYLDATQTTTQTQRMRYKVNINERVP